jgi:hypothetical protein
MAMSTGRDYMLGMNTSLVTKVIDVGDEVACTEARVEVLRVS